MASSLYELKKILLTYQELISKSLQGQQDVSELSSTNKNTDRSSHTHSVTSSIADSDDNSHKDWRDFYAFLENHDIVKENTYNHNFTPSSEYILYRKTEESSSGRILLEFIFGSETFSCKYSRGNKGAIFHKYFTHQVNERDGLALGMFCLNKLKDKFPQTVTCDVIQIDGKQIPLCASIKDAWEILHPTDFLSEISNEDAKYTFTQFLQNKSGWRVLMDDRMNLSEKEKIYQHFEKYYKKDKKMALKLFKIMQKEIVSKLEETPLGVYFLDKVVEKKYFLDLQVIRFIQGAVTIYIDQVRSTNKDNYKNFGSADGMVDLRYRIHVQPSLFKAIATSCFEKINEISDSDSETAFTQEDYIRVLYSVARCCRENAGHFTSAYYARKKISELFPGVYTEVDKTKILSILCDDSLSQNFLSQNNAIFRFTNKAYRLFIDGLGTAKYTEENLLSFISAQHGIDRKIDMISSNGDGRSNTRFDHINDLRYETLMVYSAAFIENAKNRDHVLKQLLNVAEDFDVRNRKLQASCVHTLSYILLDCDYLIPNSLRVEIFESAFGKNAYPLQKKIGKHLLRKEFYKKIYEKNIKEALEEETGSKYAKRDSLFFLHVHPDALPPNVDLDYKKADELFDTLLRNIKELSDHKKADELFDAFGNSIRSECDKQIKELSDHKKAIELFDAFLSNIRSEYKDIVKQIKELSDHKKADEFFDSFLSNIRSKYKETVKQIKELSDYKKAVALFDSSWNNGKRKITTSQYKQYKKIIEQIKTFVNTIEKDSGETLPVLDNLQKIHTAEYLLYALADLCLKWEIQDSDGIKEVQKLAVIADYSKKKKCHSYNCEDWQNGMYMTCGAARVLSVLAKQKKIQQSEKFALSEEVKKDWKQWLQKELTVAYKSTGSLRYTLFMIRLLSLTNIKTKEIEEIILEQKTENVEEFMIFESGKQAFQQCFETTCFLEYDAFPSDYNSVCDLLGLEQLK